MAAPPEGGNTVEARKNSVARIRANNKYAAKAYDRINIAVPKGRKDVIQEYAQQQGESINAFIGRAIMEAMERDSGGAAVPGVAPAGCMVCRGPVADTAGSPQETAGTSEETGAVSLPPDTLEAAERTGETVPAFVARAVAEQQKRDNNAFKLGINPA